MTFEFEPGSRYQYSGEGFEYLRKALENKFNKKLEVLAQELIFTPLAMYDTHFIWSKNMDESRYAHEHDENGEPISFKKHTQANAAANLLTTIADYGKFMVSILNGAGLSNELYEEMISKQVNVKENIDFGLGWQRVNNLANGEFALQHTGSDYGIKTIAILLPQSKRGLIVFSNSENGMVVWQKLIEEILNDTGTKLIKINLKE